MIGVFDYTVILTYLSSISAVIGIFVSLNGNGHPFMGIFFLMFCGLCDAFDGRVARMKKDRTQFEKDYGVQIDSLSDLVAFGVLPACIGDAALRIYPKLEDVPHVISHRCLGSWLSLAVNGIMVLYILAALIRLAFFNATEEERTMRMKNGEKVFFYGLPVTSAALIFPFVMLLQYVLVIDLTPVYFGVMFIVAILFVTKFRIPKPGLKGVLIMVGIGIAETIALLVYHTNIMIH